MPFTPEVARDPRRYHRVVPGPGRQDGPPEGPQPGLGPDRGDGRTRQGRDQGARPADPRPEPGGPGRGPGPALRRRPVRRADRPPGDGRGRQGRHDQARHVGRQPAGLPGLQLQEAFGRGSRPQLPLAVHAVPARAGADRDLQPVVLRGRPRREGPPRAAGGAAAAGRVGREEVLAAALPGHQRVRAAPGPQRDGRSSSSS